MAASSGAFALPPVYSYPPYFTLQPVKESREKQISLWHDLLLSYCRHHKLYVVPALVRKVSALPERGHQPQPQPGGRQHHTGGCGHGRPGRLGGQLAAAVPHLLALAGRVGEHAVCLRPVHGMSDVVMTVDELPSGAETRGTE